MQLGDFLAKLKRQGHKTTPQRKAVIQALMDIGERPTAKEIWAEIQKTKPNTSLDTVYRNLHLLVDLGIVSQINLRFRDSSRFELSGLSHHHHLVCLGCGTTVCLHSCPIETYTLNLGKDKDFDIVGHAFEIYGYCPECKKAG